MGMVNLALLYAEGKGVERNEAAAVSLYQKAKGLGNTMAMYNFTRMLQSGRGVPHKDADKAARSGLLRGTDRRLLSRTHHCGDQYVFQSSLICRSGATSQL